MCRDKVDDDVIRNVERIIELVMIRDNMLQLSSNVFSLMDIRDVISFYVQIDCVSVCFEYFLFFITFYVYFVYDFILNKKNKID